MASRGSSTEDISGWLTPSQAFDLIESVFRDRHSALEELKARLRGGMVVAVCHTTSIQGSIGIVRPGLLNRIGSEDWAHVYSDNEVWVSGTLTLEGGYRDDNYTLRTIRFFDVRFNPSQINEIVALHQVGTPPEGPSPGTGTSTQSPLT